MIWERYRLSKERIAEVAGENAVALKYQDFFRRTADFLSMTAAVCEQDVKNASLEELEKQNYMLYQDILPENYGSSYGNPAYAAEVLGEYGQLLSFLYTELRGTVVYAYEKRIWDMVVCQELFLEVYSAFLAYEHPSVKSIRETLYWHISDYSQEMIERRIRESIDPSLDFAVDLVMHADLDDPRYLYAYGEYVTKNELGVAKFLNTFTDEEMKAMARTFTEGYRIGFINGRKDITKKKTVNIRYCLGFERMVREAVRQFEKMGLSPVIYRAASHLVNQRQKMRIGYYGGIPNKQFDYDHRNDIGLFLDEDFVKRKLRSMQTSYEKYKDLAAVHGGPAVIEVFGETPFAPAACPVACTLTEEQQKLLVELQNESGQITNRYIKGEERSFTIIAYPIPEIGPDFEGIFRETVKINTLDYQKYQRIQQTIIDALDTCQWVEIKGRGSNETDLMIQLHELSDPEKQTNFENCVADVNIPVGEVFTSPQLAGTAGILHVSRVYLNDLLFQDLKLFFDGGQVIDYSCSNFETEEENRRYIEENLLFHHVKLPMGEFAIGTNTTAYVMAEKYGISHKLPILIAEKMGPHFAVGDTCYSWSEDTPVYNPDGKEIIARDNEISILRKEDLSLAYYGCHTDITIPYEELGVIRGIDEDGEGTAVIRDGRFVLPGTEELNAPFIDKEQES
ncbi:MAG: aminopeptidase [Blautia sp.]